MPSTDPPPELAAPGAGLPPLEAWLLRRLLFPLATIILNRARARKMFLAEGARILKLADTLSDEQFVQPVLIDRLRGIEDSSRHWSVAMTIEHLLIVGSGVQQLLEVLARGERPQGEVDIATLKPTGRDGVELKDRFRIFNHDFVSACDALAFPSTPQHPHPWFGPLPAAKWFKLAAIHQGLHRKQVERIVAELR